MTEGIFNQVKRFGINYLIISNPWRKVVSVKMRTFDFGSLGFW
jgi:hypothetical protein